MTDIATAAPGAEIGRLTADPITRHMLALYCGASGDHNPIHVDLDFAKAAGMPDVFAHGMLTMGLTGKMLTNYVGDGRLTKFGVRFTNQVWPGDTLTSTATVTELREEDGDKLVDLEVKTTNQDGTTVVSGYATAKVDP